MGSPMSPVIANMYMEHLEETALGIAPLQPTLWLRYVDDTFVIWPHGDKELQHFHKHINQQHPNLQFTIEEEKGGKLAFLDVQVTRSSDGLTMEPYSKPTLGLTHTTLICGYPIISLINSYPNLCIILFIICQHIATLPP